MDFTTNSWNRWKKSIFSALIYVPDHGEDVLSNIGHDRKFRTIDSNRIPLFISVSDSYYKNNLSKVNALIKNKDAFFTNDNIYDLLIDMMNISTPHYNKERVLTNSRYQRTLDSMILDNDLRVDEDPILLYRKWFSTLSKNKQNSFYLCDTKTIFQAIYASSFGVKNIEIPIVIDKDSFFIEGTNYSLENFITLLKSSNYKFGNILVTCKNQVSNIGEIKDLVMSLQGISNEIGEFYVRVTGDSNLYLVENENLIIHNNLIESIDFENIQTTRIPGEKLYEGFTNKKAKDLTKQLDSIFNNNSPFLLVRMQTPFDL